MYDPSEALLQLGLYDYVWGNPALLQTYNANVQAAKAREEQAKYNQIWKQIEDRNAQMKEAAARQQELKEASVEMAKLNKDLINAKPQEAVIIRKQQEALVNRYPELSQSSADAIAARKAEQDYQKEKTGYIGKIPHTFANDAAIDAQIQDILKQPENIIRDEDKEPLIKELQSRKSTEQMSREASQSQIASHAGEKTKEQLNNADLMAKANTAISANSRPSSLTPEIRQKIRELGYTWNGAQWVK
jgi:hypothetical protein